MGVGAGLYMCDVVKKVHVRYLISWWVLVTSTRCTGGLRKPGTWALCVKNVSNISRSSAAACLRCGGIFCDDHITITLDREKIWKTCQHLAKLWATTFLTCTFLTEVQASAVNKPPRRAASRRTCCKQGGRSVWWTCDRTKLTTLRVENRQFSATALAFNPSHLHLALPLGVTPFEFCRDFRHQKTRYS